jgi:hypothetical protein
LPFAAAALSASVASCHQPQSVLLVEVAGDLSLTPTYLSVSVAPANAAHRDFQINTSPGVATLPASFTVQLPGTIIGPVTISITAIDATGLVLASGMATQQNLDVGGQTIIVVTLINAGTSDATKHPDAGQNRMDAHPTDAHTATDAHAADAHPTADAHAADAHPTTDAHAASDGGGQ